MPADSKSKARKSDAEGGNSKKKSKHSEEDREEEERDEKSEVIDFYQQVQSEVQSYI